MPCNSPCRWRVSNNEMWRETSGGEGAYLSLFADRSHLPLRGKLGWMTPRAGVKTTPAIETRLPGPPIPSGGPSFFAGPAQNSAALSFLLERSCLQCHVVRFQRLYRNV